MRRPVGSKHVAGAAVDAFERGAEHVHRIGTWCQQPGSDIEPRAIAAAGRSDHRDELASADGQGHVADRGVALARIVAAGESAGDAVRAAAVGTAP